MLGHPRKRYHTKWLIKTSLMNIIRILIQFHFFLVKYVNKPKNIHKYACYQLLYCIAIIMFIRTNDMNKNQKIKSDNTFLHPL